MDSRNGGRFAAALRSLSWQMIQKTDGYECPPYTPTQSGGRLKIKLRTFQTT